MFVSAISRSSEAMYLAVCCWIKAMCLAVCRWTKAMYLAVRFTLELPFGAVLASGWFLYMYTMWRIEMEAPLINAVAAEMCAWAAERVVGGWVCLEDDDDATSASDSSDESSAATVIVGEHDDKDIFFGVLDKVMVSEGESGPRHPPTANGKDCVIVEIDVDSTAEEVKETEEESGTQTDSPISTKPTVVVSARAIIRLVALFTGAPDLLVDDESDKIVAGESDKASTITRPPSSTSAVAWADWDDEDAADLIAANTRLSQSLLADLPGSYNPEWPLPGALGPNELGAPEFITFDPAIKEDMVELEPRPYCPDEKDERPQGVYMAIRNGPPRSDTSSWLEEAEALEWLERWENAVEEQQQQRNSKRRRAARRVVGLLERMSKKQLRRPKTIRELRELKPPGRVKSLIFRKCWEMACAEPEQQ